MDLFKQDVNPVDAGAYLAAGENIPFKRTMLGKMFIPQSAKEIMQEGYKPMTNIGIISNILGKADKFATLPRADQAFISSQMGYTGPTVFGENQSGLSKDAFGLNTRSAFGNYAERVGEEVTKLEAALEKARGKYDTEEDFLNATQLMRTKLNFYREKVKERDELRRQDEERIAQEKAKDDAAFETAFKQSAPPNNDPNQDHDNDGIPNNVEAAGGSYDGGYQAAEGGFEFTGSQPGTSDLGYTDSGDYAGLARGGRVYFMDGGIVDLVDIYD